MSTPRLLRTAAELKSAIAEALASKGGAGADAGNATGQRPLSLGLVPTMGALHQGHRSMMDAARAENDVVVATVFVNPLQFNDPEDLRRYPRTLEADLKLLGDAGVDLVFAPAEEEVYPGGPPLVRVSSGELGARYEGASRPGHFDGVLTVVAKLLHYASPTASPAAAGGTPVRYRAYFGQKDAQQLALIRRMAADLSFDADIKAVPVVRAPDGLAESSRNVFLDPEHRRAATVLSRALFALRDRVSAGAPPDLAAAVALVEAEPLVKLDYFDIVDPQTLQPLASLDRPLDRPALALLAAQVGSVRLIDNLPLELSGNS
ncbi:pantoate--beta-alanine ligase [Arthrobacter sp. APC 3897]|uniref:pantoate--beta-alanine ligase n=1 Tax=Arthrobacter sp. APC 3897 TaxID=3035204 RepID=UPI0025B292E3|nr:pantoate--beta-alanine ligase [Arthrobacter sp. APC 3897]MDN3482498.1 pantoate--beta-alanine ligase [Arthrobacter sp. APC 3897]